MLRIITAILALLLASMVYFLLLLRRKRSEFAHLPSPPMTSWFWGHLDIAAECTALFPHGIHSHTWFRYVQKKYDLPDVFYLDWWPLGPRWLIVSNPELIGNYITTTQSLPKSALETDYLDVLLSPHNLLSLEGQRWKNIRAIFNPGFSATHLMTLVPYMVDASLIFRDVIYEKAVNNQLFELEEYGTRLTIDIIGKVVLDSDFDSQKGVHPIVSTFRDRMNYMPPNQGIQGIFDGLQFLRRWKLYRNGFELDRLIGEELDRKMAARSTSNGSAKSASTKDRKRSVIDLALDAYQKDFAPSPTSTKLNSTTPKMDAEFRNMAIANMKTFIFAGHDTTASTIAYLFHLLHFQPSVHAKLTEELHTIFGSKCTAASIASSIKSDPYTINKLEYTTAVIKETLRLFPPASTLRRPAPSSNLTFPNPSNPSQQLPLSGFDVWPIAHLVARNETFFPKPTQFIPERFLPSQTPFAAHEHQLFTPAGKEAFRVFEKGPRSCAGEGLAMLEMKIIAALTVLEFDFTCEFNGRPVANPWGPEMGDIETAVEVPRQKEEWDSGTGRWAGKGGKKIGEDGHWVGRTVEGHECWQILRGAAKPRGGMPGRMSLRT